MVDIFSVPVNYGGDRDFKLKDLLVNIPTDLQLPTTFKKGKMILIRYGAYGDLLFMSAVLPYLFKRYEIIFETNTKGYLLFGNDPRFKAIFCYEPFKIPEHKRQEVVMEHWRQIHETFSPEYRILNFFQSMETTCIVHESHPDARYLSQEERAKKYGKNFYEKHFEIAGIDFPPDFVPEPIYLNEVEEQWGRAWRQKNKDYFVMLVAIAGSTMQKVFPVWLESFCKKLIDDLPRLKIYLLGDAECIDEDWEYERTVSLIPIRRKPMISFRQALIMAKYADYVFGPETGLLVGAGMWGTPKTALMTTASVEQFAKYTLNDYSEQSLAPCSPCYRTCYTGVLCEKEVFYGVFPRCTTNWDFNKLRKNIENEYFKKFPS